MKKLISLILCLVAILSVFALASCANDPDQKPDGPDGPKDPEDTYLEELDFDGQVVTFALASATMGDPTSRGYIACDVEEKNGDAVVDAIYDRNQEVERRLNVDIEVALCTGHTKFTENVLPSLLSLSLGCMCRCVCWGKQGGLL